jgi:hypothetical protein
MSAGLSARDDGPGGERILLESEICEVTTGRDHDRVTVFIIPTECNSRQCFSAIGPYGVADDSHGLSL